MLNNYFKGKFEFLFLIILFAIIIFSRLPFISKYLFDWDSVGYALAFTEFNIAMGQPQSPGYILYIAFGKVVNLIFNDPNLSMIFLSIIFTVFTVFIIYFLTKQIFSKTVGVIASILLIFFPIFWFYGEIASIYMVAAFFSCLIAYCSYQYLEGDDRFLIISSVVLGISGGFRQDLLVFMFPLWFFCLIYKDFNYKKVVMGFICLFTSSLLWFIPTIILSGGYHGYSLTHELLIGSFQSSSIFFGANFLTHLSMDYRLISWTLIGIGIINSLILWCYLCLNWKKIFTKSNLRNVKVIYLLFWILPAFLFYALIYIAKPGYTLIYLPVFSIIIASVLVKISSGLNKKFKMISTNRFTGLLLLIIAIFSITQFLLPANVNGYATIQLEDEKVLYYGESLNKFSPGNTLVFYGFADDFRKSTYYFPEYESYSYVYFTRSEDRLIEIYHYQDRVDMLRNQDTILINSSTDKFIWFIDTNFYVNDISFLKELQSKIEVKNYTLPDGKIVYYSEIQKNLKFTVNNITIIKN